MWELRSRVRRSRSAAAATVREEEEEVERNHDEVTATMDVVETEGNYVNPIIIEEVEEIPTPGCE
ncbi:hypothetical protein MKW94_018326, partial [Papaver nudicaule]|nr:hypothetical protein [Papaver nudicaule]